MAYNTLRLPCRIVGIEGERYSLLSSIGWLSGLYSANQLNETRGAMASANIPRLPLGLKRITLAAAFKELYNRPSIAALQGGRKGKERAVGRRGVQRPAVVATSAMAA